ncbi:MAG TPA: APC family permease [Trebonia sp.]|nr:APC family permease [Trebonia sp.]
MAVAPVKAAQTKSALRSGALGFPALLAQSVALISPTMTAVLIIPLAFSNAGEGTWLAYLFGTVMLLFVVFCLNQFARRCAAPGAMYTYTARGLGPATGVLSGWTLLWCYLFIGTAGLTGFAIFFQQFLDALGFTGTVPPDIFFAISAATCWYIAYKDIRVSSLITLALEGISVTLILSLAAVVLFSRGVHIDTAQLQLKGVGPHGMSLAVVACIFSLVGFESATALGGEARNPLRNVPRAVIWSLILTGLFMVVMSYVEVYGTRHYGTPLGSIAAPLNVLAQIYTVTFFKAPISLGAMISFFSLSLSCLNAGARILYPMGEHMVFPHQLGRAHPRNGTPHVAITVYVAIMFAIPTVLELVTNPLTAFGDAGTLAAFGFLLAYFLITIAAPAYLRRRGELRVRHVIIAVIACLCLLVPTIGSFYPAPPFPVNIFPYIFAAYMAVGASWLFALSRRRRGIFAEIETDLEATLPA